MLVPRPLPLIASLDGVHPGDRIRVSEVRGEEGLRRRLFELGLVRGTELKVVRLAPLGDPMEIVVRGYHLSLRRSEARSILVEPLG